MGTFQQHFEIDRPLQAVTEAFSQPEALLQSLPGVTSVTRAGEDLYRVAFGTREVELAFVRFPPHRIEWRTTDAQWRGAVELQALGPGRTAVAMTAEASSEHQGAPSATHLHEGLHALKR